MADVAKQQVPKITKQGGPTPKNLKTMSPAPIDDDLDSQVHATTHTNGTQNGTHDEEYENETNAQESTIGEEEEEGSEAIPAGSVDQDGNVVDDEGNIIGHVNGETASQYRGSLVDQEGDVLDDEGNIIAKAELVETVAKSELGEKTSVLGDKSQLGEKTSVLDDKPELGDASELGDKADLADKSVLDDKPELGAPFGVQDNGEITNATGVVVGKLTEGDPQDLVARSIKDIDAEGNLKAASGSVLGKAELQSELLEKVEGASEVGSQIPDDKLDVASATGSKLPEGEAPEVKLDEEGHPLPEGLEGASVSGSKLPEGLEGASVAGSKLPEGASVAGSKLPEGLEGASVSGSKLPEGLEGASVAGSKLPEGEVPEVKLDEDGNPLPEGLEGASVSGSKLPEGLEGASVAGSKLPEGLEGASVAGSKLPEGEVPEVKLDEDGNPLPESAKDLADELPDLSILKGKKVNKLGKIVDENGNPFGLLIEGELKKLVGKKVDGEGKIWDDSGRVIGRAELLPETDREAEPSAPFEDFPDSIVDAKGNVIFEGKIVGKLIEGDAKKLEGKKVDADGDVLDKNGNVLGKAERYQEEDEIPEEVPEAEDVSILEGMKVNKAGNIVDDHGKLFGRLISGDRLKLIGKRCDKDGKIWGESGKCIGVAELIPLDDRDEDSGAPFEDFPDAIVDKHGNILFEGQIVGKLIEGDAKKLVGKKIDQDGEIVDKIGNILGRAERWIEEDAPEPEKVDLSALAGKRVNKIGNIVDSHGEIYGRLIEGDPKKLAGRMCDKNGHVFDEAGHVVGRAELVPEGERQGQKEGPFAGFSSPSVAKDGKVTDSKGVIIGRLIEGDAKKLYGKEVDADGDVLDRNGNVLGKAERWEEEEKPKAHNPVAGRKVNREGNVVDENGDVIAKLTEGIVTKCSGKEIDEDGDVYNQKGQVIGHVTLLEDIPPEPEAEPEPVPEPVPEEPKETPEEIEEKRQLALDKKLASQMAFCIQGSLDKISPILKMITETIDAAERQPKEELDEQKLVDTVRPLIEQGGQILTEANGVIRGLDPDGRIAANAKHKTAAREATPEEYRLADVLKELAGNVTTTIENAKKKIAGMPHAKKELNPLWGLLAEPLGQILAAVGLLLAGVLGLVGRLLSGLGLGGLLDNLLGGLGLKGILKGLGLGMVTEALTGRKN